MYSYLTFAVISIILLITCIVSYVLYSNIFKAIDYTEEDVFFEATRKIQPINFDKFERVESEWNKKQTSSLPSRIIDPLTHATLETE